MVLMLSIDLDLQTREMLLEAALGSIRHGIAHGEPPVGHAQNTRNPRLLERAATFVTLKQYGHLRGCIGTLQVQRTLLDDVLYNAFAAAFRDPRFSAITSSDLENLEISISLLGPQQEMTVRSESDLIKQLDVGIDGLVLEEGNGISATFLPSVWESLPKPEDFLINLKRKAGIHDRYWSDTLRFYRYRTCTFSNISPD